MVKDFIKFLQKHPLREKLLDIMEDIYYDKLDGYDVKPLVGHDGLFRLRKGTIRFIFEKTTQGNRIHHIGNRGDVYKSL